MAKTYVIRFRDGRDSSPLNEDEIRKRILNGELNGSDELSVFPSGLVLKVSDLPEFHNPFEADEPTRLSAAAGALPENQKTAILDRNALKEEAASPAPLAPKAPVPVPMDDFSAPEIRSEKTRVIERPKGLLPPDPPKKGLRALIPNKNFLVLLLLLIVLYEMNEDDEEEAARAARAAQPKVVMVKIRPKLPAAAGGAIEPKLSVKLYESALSSYALDTVKGYQIAAELFHKSLRADPGNVKALALLASCYLNLIESSNKDEKTYSVINKLIELSKARQIDLIETVIAEAEFLAAQNRLEAAIQRLTEYVRNTGKFDPAVNYYLGWLSYLKGDSAAAAKHLEMIVQGGFPSPLLPHLRGLLWEERKDWVQAEAEYTRALTISPRHAKSILGLIRISEHKGELKARKRQIEFLLANASEQSPAEHIRTLIYASKLALLEKKPKASVDFLERATRIDPRDEALRLEYYSLLSSLEKDDQYKKLARMYAFVLDAERKQRQGELHEAKATLLQARDQYPASTVPLEKMGDLFFKSGEFSRAYDQYKKALDLDPKQAPIAVKAIDALIRNKEIEEASKLIAKYRTHPKLKSSVDRLAGDLAYDQGDFENAALLYQKAMSRDSIDPEVYSSYANLLREADQCRDAQFFYALARRLDPMNASAILGNAKCILKTDGVSAAVSAVQEELARLPKARPDLIAGIGRLYWMAQDEAKAIQFAESARELDPEHPDAYLVEAEVYLQQMLFRREMKKRALESLKAYSDRKSADPYGYLKRFELFLAESNFEAATEELNRVFEVSPRYPGLHYRRGAMYRKMGRLKDALSELDAELKLNPRMDGAWVEQGEILIQEGDLAEALKSLSKAMALNPQNIKARIGAGYANYLKKQYSSAIALYQSALALDKGRPEIYKKLGLAYRESGDKAAAKRFFQNYLDLAPDASDRAEMEGYLR